MVAAFAAVMAVTATAMVAASSKDLHAREADSAWLHPQKGYVGSLCREGPALQGKQQGMSHDPLRSVPVCRHGVQGCRPGFAGGNTGTSMGGGDVRSGGEFLELPGKMVKACPLASSACVASTAVDAI